MTYVNIVLRLFAVIALILISTLADSFASEIERLPAISASTPDCDVALNVGGSLIGQVVNEQGLPKGSTKVLLMQHDKALATTQTDVEGRFEFSGLRPGVYQINTPYGSQVCRAWAHGTAPPGAKNGVMMVTSNEIVRGQLLNQPYRTVFRSAAAGGLLTGFIYWALDHNPPGT